MKRSRPLSPARTSSPIPTLVEIASAIAVGAIGLTSSRSAGATPPLPPAAPPPADAGAPDATSEAKSEAKSPSLQDVAAARKLYEEAVRRFEAGDWDGAQAMFQRAYDLAPSFRVLYPMAQAQLKRGDEVAALGLFERYLEDGGAEIPAARKEEAAGRIAEIRGRIGEVMIRVYEAGAEIVIDDRRVGASPLLKPLFLASGSHTITVTRPGQPAETRTVVIAAASSTEIFFEPVPVPPIQVLGGVPPPPVFPHGMCACDLPGGGGEGASLDVIAAAAAAILAAGRARRRRR